MNNHAAIARVSWIARRLRDGKSVNCTDVVKQFECSTKTAWRDFEFLRDRLGYVLEFDRPQNSFLLIHAPDAVLL